MGVILQRWPVELPNVGQVCADRGFALRSRLSPGSRVTRLREISMAIAKLKLLTSRKAAHPCPPPHRDPRRRRGRLFAPDGGG
jgi:hypothetical protein